MLPLVAVGLGFVLTGAEDPHHRYGKDDAEWMRWRMGELCTEEGVYFTGSGNCVNCHAPDPDGEALVDEHGATVSPVADWQATLMANSARDPFWQAKVDHEGLVNPAHREAIENVCTACHAPQGFHEAHMTGAAGPNGYTMDDLMADELGLDGVGCTGCHSIDNDNLAGRSNGDLPINTENVAWGGFENPWDGLMSGQTGFIPAFGEHMRSSEVCASCHSLYTHTQDLDGEETGQIFFEQTTYLEWVNSAFNAENVQCQTCHMPLVEGGAIAATQPNWLFPQRFGKHHFVGGNAFMLKLMRDNAVQLNLSATSTQFDSTIARTTASLQQATANLNVRQLASSPDEWAFEVEVENLAGHKFPSGYPARVAFLEFTLVSTSGDTLFHSGAWSRENGIAGRDAGWEPHWNEITEENQVQIYELVLGDVAGQTTQVLERAAEVLKDNRLVPRGFSSLHPAYDTVAVGPMASLDADFNRRLGEEGSGTDRLVYRVPAVDGSPGVEATVRLHYQAVPAQWVAAMFEFSDQSERIANFESMYDAADRTPVVVAEQRAMGWPGFDPDGTDWRLAPNPVHDGQLLRLIPAGEEMPLSVDLFDMSGRHIRSVELEEMLTGHDVSDLAAGNYLVKLGFAEHFSTVRWMKSLN
ncbi:MAG: T9SS type A sorting domain-containing protein [Flavobacteriales bacterium]